VKVAHFFQKKKGDENELLQKGLKYNLYFKPKQ
jgi:hypothetical protein